MYEELKDSIIKGDSDAAKQLTETLLSENRNPSEILNSGLLQGMGVVGQRFKNYEMYLPEVIMSAEAMNGAVTILKPVLAKNNISLKGKILLATIEGDVHNIGKNLVRMMLEGSGYEVIDLGVDVPIDKINQQANSNKVDIVGISALLTTTMTAMEGAIKTIKDSNSSIKVMIGGAPVTQEYGDEIGADGFAPDAVKAVELANRLMKV